MQLLFLFFSIYLVGYIRGESFDSDFCKAAVKNGTFGMNGTTDRNGNLLHTANLSLIEGYQYQYCVDNCGDGSDFNKYSTFSEQAAIWFLPWFFLVAQIPYFTCNKFGDLVVMLLSIGSPTTALYSLFLTILDRKWLKSHCDAQLELHSVGDPSRETLDHISEVLNSLHQFPVEVEDTGLLACTFSDREWWRALRTWFVRTRRHLEASAYAQLLLTVLIYFLAVLPAAFADLGDATTAHGLAIGNIWMWLIPLVWGWFAVGTHHSRRHQVTEKLYKSARDITLPNDQKSDPMERTAIKISDSATYFGSDNFSGRRTRRTFLGCSIGGDELADGPFYNYARCWTWSNLSRQVIQTYIDTHKLSRTQQSGEYSNSPPSRHLTVLEERNYSQHSMGALASRVLEDGGNFESVPLKRFGWRSSDGRETWVRKIRAFGMAFVLHGIFGVSAFMIDYMTPTIGVGCRAFICMTYGLVSVFSCALLIIASEWSDSWSFQMERYQWRMEEVTNESSHQSTRIITEPSHLLAAGAVIFRVLGKALASLNAVFIVAGCILEFVGLYESCFCKSSHLGLGGRAYVSFLSTEESVQIARPYWYGGAGAAILAVLIVCFGYFRRLPRAAK